MRRRPPCGTASRRVGLEGGPSGLLGWRAGSPGPIASGSDLRRPSPTAPLTRPRSSMALLSLRGVGLAFGGPRLLDRVDWQVERGERIGLLGRNGEGKSTLLRLIDGEIGPDEGEVVRPQGLRTARLPQEVPEGRGGTVADEVAQ